MHVPLSHAHDESEFGGKSSQLARAQKAGLPVPPGAALSWSVLGRTTTDEARLAIARAIAGAVDLERGVAVRSSAVGEDSAHASFAGQHLTVLGVRSIEGLASAILRVVDSGRTEAAMAYRKKLGLPPEPKMGVVVQQLVYAVSAGVLFTKDPLSGEDVRVVEATWGLGEAVVAGLVTPDRFRIARGGRVLERAAGDKDLAIRWAASAEGTVEEEVEPDLVEMLCLDDEQLAMLDDLATKCEAAFGGSQDLEFAFEAGSLYLLQRRAITRG